MMNPKYNYDASGQLKSARAKEPGGTTNRLHEQLGYVYDAAGNLNYRTNSALVQSFSVNSLNELTSVGRITTNFTVAGAVQGTATSVTVNGVTASLYGDQTFAKGDTLSGACAALVLNSLLGEVALLGLDVMECEAACAAKKKRQ